LTSCFKKKTLATDKIGESFVTGEVLRKLVVSLIVIPLLAGLSLGADSGSSPVTELKKLHLETVLVKDRVPRAVIVVPSDRRHSESVSLLRSKIKSASGIILPVVMGDYALPEAVLSATNAIVLGNMSTSRFIERLYREWYTFLDLWYPGKGGHVLRSLHNPYGTGKNVIFLGGSDDEGVSNAVKAFIEQLGSGPDLSVGRLMEIHLGADMNLPKVGEDIYSWRDSYRIKPGGKGYGATLGTFGWHPISQQAALYYMTGRKEYLDEFKRLVFYPPDNVPKEILTCVAYYDMQRPLVENYHYFAHTMPMIWDLIEESPLFTDMERLKVINDLIAQQNYYTRNGTYKYPSRGTSRHGQYHLLTIFAGSRYLARSYPDPRWNEAMERVKESFSWWLKETTWGERDTITWINTSTEPVFDFFMLTDPGLFVRSGSARQMMDALEILWNGEPYETSNRAQAIDLMHKAAHMLRDGRYIWLARQARYDFSIFRIGQSWWPSPDLKIEPPTDRIGRVSVQPLSKSHWERSIKLFPHLRGVFPLENGYQYLSFRTGLGAEDDYFMVDGCYGHGRHVYHVNAIFYARCAGTVLAAGYRNGVSVRCNGMVPTRVPEAASLEDAIALDGTAFVSSALRGRVDVDTCRSLLWRRGRYALVFDEILSHSNGVYDVRFEWDAERRFRERPQPRIAQSDGTPCVTLACADPLRIGIGNTVTEIWRGPLKSGESATFANLLCPSPTRGEYDYSIARHSENSFVVTGSEAALAWFGPLSAGDIRSDAGAAYISPSSIVVVGCKEFEFGDISVVSDNPVSIIWDFESGKMLIQSDTEAKLTIKPLPESAVLQGRTLKKQPIQLRPGKHLITSATPTAEIASRIGEQLQSIQPKSLLKYAWNDLGISKTAPEWKTDWLRGLSTNVQVKSLAAVKLTKNIAVGLGNRLFLLDQRGEIRRSIEFEADISSMLAYEPDGGDTRAMLLVGLADDQLAALGTGGDERWRVKAMIDPGFRVGERYEAPWFTDPDRGNVGINSLLVADVSGSGSPEIVPGRATTLEFRKLSGELIRRVPLMWGDCRHLAYLSRLPDGDKTGPYILVGKFFTGSDNVTIVDRERNVVGQGYRGIRRATEMRAWMQRGISHLRLEDLDEDGIEEVIVVRSGHWNDVRVYQGGTQRCLWNRFFGPAGKRAAFRTRFMRVLCIGDLDSDGKKEVVVGMRNGWVCAFRSNGEVFWTRRFSSVPEAMVVSKGNLAVGFRDGMVMQLDSRGLAARRVEFGSAISVLLAAGDGVVVGTKGGEIASLKHPEQ